MERHSEMPGPGPSRQNLVEAGNWEEAIRCGALAEVGLRTSGKMASDILEPKDRPEERFTYVGTFIIKQRPK